MSFCTSTSICAALLLGSTAGIASAALNTPSTDLFIDPSGGTTAASPAGVPGAGSYRPAAIPNGYQLTDEFQLTAIYQAGVSDADIDKFNEFPDNNPQGSGFVAIGRHLNFPDFEAYVLQIDRNGLDVYKDNVATFDSGLDWTLSYRERTDPSNPSPDPYDHTILAGVIEGTGAESFLRITPDGRYRSFGEVINETEVFDNRLIQTDAVGYFLPLDANDVPTSSTGAVVVPEPASFAILGLGGAALIARRRRPV